MALAAPVEYWESKRKKHRNIALISGITVIVAMICIGKLLYSKMQDISDVVLTQTVQLAQNSSVKSNLVQTPATWHLGSFLILVVISFWAIRIIVRIFLSNMHLENDAAERVTMAKTYLAFLRSDGLPKGDNINTVLAALFRPTGDGIVKDEGVPPSTLDWFTKLGR